MGKKEKSLAELIFGSHDDDEKEEIVSDFKIRDGVLIESYKGGDIVIPDTVKEIREYAFSCNKSVTSVIIPNSVKKISKAAFEGCRAMTSVIIPASVKKIGKWAFLSCESLTSITIPDSVKEIGMAAFANCYGLTSITIPDSVNKIANNAFYQCTGLSSVTFLGNAVKIGEEAFRYCKVKVVNVLEEPSDEIRGAFSADVVFNILEKPSKKESSIGKSGKVTVEIEGIVSRARLQHMSNSDAAKAKKAIAALGSSKFSEVKKAGLVGDGELFYDAEETETFIVKVNSLSLDGQEFNPVKLCCTADKVLACPVPVHEPGVYWAALHEVCYDGREGGIIVQFDQYPEAEPRTYTCEIELGEGEEFDISKLSFGLAYKPCLDSRHKYTGKSDVYINPNSLTYNGKEYVLQSEPAFDEDDFADAGLYHELEMGFVEVEKTESGTLTYKVIKGWTGDYNLKRYDVD